MSEVTSLPACVVLFSGKRKSGKDFITDALISRLGEKVCNIIKISGPIKQHWAKVKGVSFDLLMSSDEMKEQHRKDMLIWSEAIRNNDPGYFCRAAISMYNAKENCIWIVSDVRRKSDINWFKDNYGELVMTVRIQANDHVRSSRGWTFTPGIDDAETECGLDDFYCWDIIVCNDGSNKTDVILDTIVQKMSSRNSKTKQLLAAIS